MSDHISQEPLKSILRHHHEEEAPSEVDSVTHEGSIRSVSSLGQLQEASQSINAGDAALNTEGATPEDPEQQQFNFSRPKRSRIPVSTSSPIPKPTSPNQISGSLRIPSRMGSIKRARNSLEALEIKKNRLSATSTEALNSTNTASGDPRRPTQHSSPTPVQPRNLRLTPRQSDKRRSVPVAKAMPRSGMRAVSGPANQSIMSIESPSSLIQRQRSSSTPRRTPGPLNRPEGDPPWLATMFKPDPRLPPEQQMLPTHAKRLAMQQGTFIPPTWDPEQELPTMPAMMQEPPVVEAGTQRSSSVRELLRRVSTRSRKSEDASAGLQEQQQRPELRQQPLPPAPVAENTEGTFAPTDWPLRTPTIRAENDDDVFFTQPQNPPQPPIFSVVPNVGPEQNDGMSSAPTLSQKPSSIIAPGSKPIEPATPSPKAAPPPNIPQAPLQTKPEKDRTCGCCIVM